MYHIIMYQGVSRSGVKTGDSSGKRMKVHFERTKFEVAHTVLSKVTVLQICPLSALPVQSKINDTLLKTKSASVDASKEGQPSQHHQCRDL